ncbi:phage tail protein, partial [Escherichia coli]|nr:phage tail protein [Escherichia coli]
MKTLRCKVIPGMVVTSAPSVRDVRSGDGSS